MTRFEFGREVPARFGHDLDATLDKPLAFPIALKDFERGLAENVADALDRFDDVPSAGE